MGVEKSRLEYVGANMDISPYIIDESTTIIEAMNVIDKNSEGVVFVCREQTILATLTDGDVRRHILKGKSLTALAIEAANFNFKFIKVDIDGTKKNTSDKTLRAFPVVDDEMQLIEIFFPDKTISIEVDKLNVPVIIMAGGKGTRLYPYTQVLPKPLIPIGDLTITEHIMNEFIKYGCNEFSMIVNHKKNLIKAFFSDSDSKYNVDFTDEDKPLGTGGGLKLLQGKMTSTFFVTNCDIIVFENYSRIYEHHKVSGNLLTMVCATKQTEFPYGTVEIDEEGRIKTLTEKPTFSFLTNSGFYVVEPKIFDYIPDNEFIHITDIIQKCIKNGEHIGVYPVSEEQWFDMGQPDELEKMRERLNHR